MQPLNYSLSTFLEGQTPPNACHSVSKLSLQYGNLLDNCVAILLPTKTFTFFHPNDPFGWRGKQWNGNQ